MSKHIVKAFDVANLTEGSMPEPNDMEAMATEETPNGVRSFLQSDVLELIALARRDIDLDRLIAEVAALRDALSGLASNMLDLQHYQHEEAKNG